jgi:dienelactone hydrolase
MLGGGAMIERSRNFGPEEALLGTFCVPDKPGARVGVILFNAGIIHRVGPHRINVRLARELAKRGIPSVRFDLSGHGDSPRAASNEAFERQAVADISAAVDALQETAGVERAAIFGFCSGGVHGYAAVQADPRIAGIVMYDTFFYRTRRSRINRYLLSIRERGLFRIVMGRLARAVEPGGGEQSLMNMGGLFRTPPPEEIAQTLRTLAARGVRVHMILSGTWREVYNYPAQMDDVFRPLGVEKLFTHEYLPNMSHNATDPMLQADFVRRIADFMTELDRSLGAPGQARAA